MGGKKQMPIGAKVKMTNKWINKMTKRGKLRKSDRAKISPYQKQFIDKITRHDEQLDTDLNSNRYKSEFDSDSDDLPIDMMDSDDELFTQAKVKKNKYDESESSDEELSTNPKKNYFLSSQHDSTSNMKHLLPIKTAAGRLVPLAVKDDVEPENQQVEATVADENDSQSKEPLTAAELFAKRAHLVEENKGSIASSCRQLIENPEHHVNKLKDLINRARGFVDPLVQFTVQKLATASLLEVFLDILPSYKIRPLSEKEETQKMKKETKHLHQYEEALLRNYKKYLQHLESISKYYQTRKLRQNGALVPSKIAEVMALLGLKSFCRLLEEHPNFNYRTNILTVIVPLMNHKFEKVRELVCQTIENCFKSDKLGEFSFDAVKTICDFNKNNPFKTHPRMLETFLSLKIKEVEKKPEGKSVKQKIQDKKNRLKLMSRKEKKFQKRMEKLDVELKELEAQENTQTVLKLHTAIMNKIFAAYFRILKQNKSRVELLAPVLEGLAKFAHMINVEFFDDLIKSLLNLIVVGELKPLESLHCTKTVFIILSGEGQSLTVDPHGFYRHVYSLLPKIVKQQQNTEMFSRQFPLCLECLDAMINGRRKQVTLHRVAAFVKRLAILCQSLSAPATAAALSSIRTFFLAHPKLDGLLDLETVGSGKYMNDLDDPDRCNALTTNIIHEMDALKNHDNSTVRQLAAHIGNGLPSEGQHRILANVSGLQPWILFAEMEGRNENSPDLNSAETKNVPNSKRKRRK